VKAGQVIEVFTSIFVSIAAFMAASWLLKVQEMNLLLQMIKSKLKKKEAPGTPEIIAVDGSAEN